MDSFFLDNSDCQLVKILLTSASPELSPEYASKVLTMFNHLFESAEEKAASSAAARDTIQLAKK